MTGVDEHIEELTKRGSFGPPRGAALVNEEDIQLLQALANGKGVPQIAAKAGKSPGAVHAWLRRLFARIKAHNAAHAIAWAFRNHYLQ